MPEMHRIDRLEHRLFYVAGQVVALKSFCFAVLASHPDLNQCVRMLEGLQEQQAGIMLGQTADEATIEGAEKMRAELLGYAKDLLAHPDTAPQA